MFASWYSKEKELAFKLLAEAKTRVDFLVPQNGLATYFLRDCVQSVDFTKLQTRIVFSTKQHVRELSTEAPEWFDSILRQSSPCRLVEHTGFSGLAIVDGGSAVVVDEREIDTGGFIQLHGVQEAAGIREFFDEIWTAAKSETLEILHAGFSPLPSAILSIDQNWSGVIHQLNQNPEKLYTLTPRRFEELIAHLLEDQGFGVELTSATRDGGRDVLVTHKTELGKFLYLVECKRQGVTNPVGVSVVRHLFGVLKDNKANAAILVTTSKFTKDAIEFGARHEYHLQLKDFAHIKTWLHKYHNRTK